MKNNMLDRLIGIGPERAFREEVVKIAILLAILVCLLPFVFQ